jgi:hypothetical protein
VIDVALAAISKLAHTVTPAQAGVQNPLKNLDSGFPMQVHPVIPAKAGIQAVLLDSG